jgi:hypothetical protein
MIEHPHRWHLSILPSSTLGRWAVVLAIVSLVALRVFYAMVDAGQVGGAGFFDNWLLTGPILVVGVSAVAGLVAAIVAIVRSRDGGLTLLIPIAWGLIVTSFTLGEFTNPH